jgi:hypothetical protein
VARLDEISLIGRYFNLGSFKKIIEAAKNFWSTFFPLKKLCINLDKKCVGLILDTFFTNASGHPGQLKQ